MPLYRGLRRDEIDAGMMIIPKGRDDFRSGFKFPICFPISLDSAENALRNHMDDSNNPRSRGVSFTTNFNTAANSFGVEGVIVEVDENRLKEYGITKYTKDDLHSNYVKYPAEEEVVLVMEESGPFPKEIIVSVYMNTPDGWVRQNYK